MKHLSPLRLQAAAEGGTLRPAESGHLRACQACRAEAEALSELMRALGDTPIPARSLDAAIMQRLGLGKPPAQRWAWASIGLATAGALALLLTLGRGPATVVPPPPQSHPPTEPIPRMHVAARQPRHRAAAHPVGTQAAMPQSVRTLDLPARVASPPPAQGSMPLVAEAPRPAAIASDPKLTTTAQAPAVASVRNNLLRPGSGPLQVDLDLPEPGPLSAVIYDQQGRRVAELYHGYASGRQTLIWDGGDAPSGTYLLLVRTEGGSQMTKVLVLR